MDKRSAPKLAAARPRATVSIALLGCFALSHGGLEMHSVSPGSQRLLAYLALHPRPHTRAHVAATLWPDTSDEHAGESLRSALARLEVPRDEVVLSDASGLRLAHNVEVDFAQAIAVALRLLSADHVGEVDELSPEAVALFSKDLLPEWMDEWVVVENEDWRQLRISALEAIAVQLLGQNRLREAALAARTAIRVDPLRESSQHTLVKIYLAADNRSDAVRAVTDYSQLISRELGILPSVSLLSLVAGLQSA
jgi:DNA-binding SARP family transcriptional activator